VRYVALLLLFVVGLAHAGTATLTWVPPTQRTDNTPLTDLASYKIYRGTSATALTTSFTVTAPATTYTDTTAPSGTVFYAMTAIDSLGRESVRTAVVSVVIPVADPKPPSGLTAVAVIADNTVYKLRQGVDGFAFVAIGTAPVGTQCLPQSVGEYAVVPRSAVTLRSKFDTLPLITFARCG
jgi:hypothetical protein